MKFENSNCEFPMVPEYESTVYDMREVVPESMFTQKTRVIFLG